MFVFQESLNKDPKQALKPVFPDLNPLTGKENPSILDSILPLREKSPSVLENLKPTMGKENSGLFKKSISNENLALRDIKPSKIITNPGNVLNEPFSNAISDYFKKSGLTIAYSKDGSSYSTDVGLILSNQSEQLFFHEFSHFWLKQEMGFTEFQIVKRNENPEFEYERKTNQRIDLDMANKGAQEHRRLNSLVYHIAQFEKAAEKDNGKNQALLEQVFGKPEDYSERKKTDYSSFDFGSGYSWIGNIVDESTTLGIRKQGHPMESYHEFFASFFTALCFDGEKFYSNLEKFKQLANEDKDFEPIFADYLEIIKSAGKHANGLLYGLNIQATSTIRINLERNLARLEKFINSTDIASR